MKLYRGVDFPAQWAKDVGNSWRTTIDIQVIIIITNN